jgi:hypothetical protein
VSATATYLFVAPMLTAVGDWPECGTPAWVALDAYDPAKLASLAYAGLRWALEEDTRQEMEREAARAVSTAAPWGHIGQELAERERFYAAKPYLKRRPA